MQGIWQDIRFGLRMLRKHRLATAVCMVALALGIGANTAIFSLAEAFLVHPVPFDNSERIVALLAAHDSGNGPPSVVDRNGIAPATYFDWKEQARSFDELAAYQWDEVNLTGDREPQKVQVFDVTANFFQTIGVQPRLGRAFLPDEEAPGKEREIILGHALWEQRYASDPSIVGKNVRVDGKNFTVVGVMSKGFDFPMPAEAWIPLPMDAKYRLRRDTHWLWPVARLKPGVSLSEVTAEMDTINRQQIAAYPDTNKGWVIQPTPLAEFMTGSITRQYMVLLIAAVGFVLLIACADVANVQFARVTGRSSEFAVRTALGGSRWRMTRQLLIESVLLSLGGAALGLVLAQWDLSMILAHMPPDVAKFVAGWKKIGLNTDAFVFTLVVAVVSGIISGIAPSLLSSRTNISETLKEGGRGASVGRTRHYLRGALVVAEVALALVLLVGAGLLVRNFQGLLNIKDGYRPETLLTLNLTLPEQQYATPASRLAFHERIVRNLSGVAGVESAAIVTHVPYADGGEVGRTDVAIEGRAPRDRGEILDAVVETTAPSYFSQFNIGLRDGRFLTEADGAESAPVAVVSASFVRNYLPPGENPLGKHVRVGKPQDDPAEHPWMTIVGVVNDVHYSWINKADEPTLYRSFRQAPPAFTTVVLRTASAPLQFVSAARTQIAAVDPDLPLYNIKPMTKVISESIIGIAYVAVMMAVLGVVALVLASVGVFGVMSYSVSERAHEIGIRMSMGAEAKDILGLVLRGGMTLTVLGLVIGLPVAFLMARAMSSVLFGVEAWDAGSFVGLPVLLAGVAALACYLPARRAASLDPLRALRQE